MKIFTFYLPQFHTIPENDIWWGKGFTEWVNVKSAKPLFEGHDQPRVPLNQDYYDLSKTEVIRKQATLAKKYGIDGFCFYHYWFDGKLLLEKPVENFLKDKSIDIEFCLSWPSEAWRRTWSGNSEEILINQNYGKEENWKKHYKYLRDYFHDPRYLKIGNKPVFIIYGSSYIPDLKSFLDYFNNLAKEDGFNGLHLVKTNPTSEEFEDRYDFDGYIEFEPYYTISNQKSKIMKLKKLIGDGHEKLLTSLLKIYKNLKAILPHKDKPTIVDYDEIWFDIVNRKSAQKTYLGAFPSWDNSPRKDKRAVIVTGSTPTKFRKYLSLQIAKSLEKKSPLLFINAWNEWGEGAYLEPDESNRYGYLEAIKDSLQDNQT